MPRILVNIDVDNLERAVQFYTAAFDLRVGRRDALTDRQVRSCPRPCPRPCPKD